ncbi:tannase/feruloyl esterase family alpha/beta hydrolase [Sphingomonas sp. ac-8]|uniref:tannase/feruloyl esterase family alpha/beta hydrolase n=1 Tax=Sphingomonas sp. ac-8 TaxID=3242977 RepID=UPI003A806424
MQHVLLTGAAVLTMALAASPAMAADCRDLAALKLHNVSISNAEAQSAQTLPADPMSAMTGAAPRETQVGEHCLVEGKIDDRQGVGGRYGIRFQIRMPKDWNGRFLFQGGGGTDGFLALAVGLIPSTGSTAKPAIRRGYAVVSMDGGHAQPNLDFAKDQQARLDLGYAAIGKVSDTAKALIRAFYGKGPSESYFMGCSNGGREAMQAAMRFPTEFDGIVAGNPGFHLSHAAIGSVWNLRQFQRIAPDGELWRALTPADLNVVAAEVTKQCDALDGVRDGIVAAFGQCRFDPKALRGKLSKAKLDALVAVMNGAHDAAGNPVYASWPWDPGIGAPGWRAWMLGTKERPAMNQSLSAPSTGQLFLTPPRDVAASPDYAALARDVAQVGGYFDANHTFLSTFASRGGKMIVFQGAADPIFSANDITQWQAAVSADTGPDVSRLFVVPGMNHCGGGPAFDDFDPLTLLEQWRETGTAPEHMPAKAPTMPDRAMPICAFPAYARYTGGDRNAAGSYTCARS